MRVVAWRDTVLDQHIASLGVVALEMNKHREPIAVIGTGYVGLVTAAGFAQLGSTVWCVDIDDEKIARLQRGEVPIFEPGLAECLARNRERLNFVTGLSPALEHARLLFVAVGTPPTHSGDADLSSVHAVVAAMPSSDQHALVMKSTVPVGTGESIKRTFREQGKESFAYVSCPEFLKEGSALEDFLKPDRVVVGDEGDWAGDAVAELYAPLGAPLVRTDVPSAEMIKLAANAFLATKISFINEIANVCEETGADVVEVAHGIGLDHRIGGHFLTAGIGYGGSCFGKDVSALKQLAGNSGYHFQLLNAVIEVNELQKRRVIAKLQKHLGALAGRRVALLGLAFKPNTDDMREASSLVLAGRLVAAGAKVSAYDPVAEAEARKLMTGVEFATGALEALEGADACVIVTEWPEFAQLDWKAAAGRMYGRLVVDGRNCADQDEIGAAGLIYEGIGRARRNQARPSVGALALRKPIPAAEWSRILEDALGLPDDLRDALRKVAAAASVG
jgi:UDPglucose 6-dehydrogenase